jgi:hypothetical protein
MIPWRPDMLGQGSVWYVRLATLVVDRNVVHGHSEHASANRNPEPWHAEPILPNST